MKTWKTFFENTRRGCRLVCISRLKSIMELHQFPCFKLVGMATYGWNCPKGVFLAHGSLSPYLSMLAANFHCINRFEGFMAGFFFVSKSFGLQSVTFLQGDLVFKELGNICFVLNCSFCVGLASWISRFYIAPSVVCELFRSSSAENTLSSNTSIV